MDGAEGLAPRGAERPLLLARERYLATSPPRSSRPLVGVVGASVPVEIVLAAGMLPVRVAGRSRPTPQADLYAADLLDPPTKAVFERVLDPHRPFEFVVIGGDTAGQSLMFQILRELRRIEPVAGMPRFSFVDVLHLPYRTTARYNHKQLTRLISTLEGWSGTTIGEQELRSALECVNATRRLLGAAMQLRRVRPARLSGTDALTLVGAALVSCPEEIQAWLAEVVCQRDRLPEHRGTRVYLTGSTHEDPAVYETLERCGCVVVGEDHPRGEDAYGDGVVESASVLDGLVEHYQFADLPTRRMSAERARRVVDAARAADADVVVAHAVDYDEATLWDLPAIREALWTAEMPFFELPGQHHWGTDESELESAIERELTALGGRRS